MKNKITKMPIWLLMVWPYIFLGGLFLGGGTFFGIFCILTLILCIANIINAWKYKGDNVAKELGFWGMVTKLIHMPFYVVAFVMGLLGMLSVVVNPANGSTFTLLFMFIMSILLMIQSSSYCTKAIFAAVELKLIKKESAMLYATTCFIMFADVICAILIYNKIKKNKKVIGA